MLQGVLIFFVFLTPLVFFHELGHFLFARLFGVRVETFSIGFGPKLLTKKIGDTVYAFSLIPLGGYVKMFGDDPLNKDSIPESEKQYAFTHKGKWARFWVVFGGPLANFILAFFIIWVLLISGERVPEPKFGVVSPDTRLYKAGVRTGDVLSRVNGKEILGVTALTTDTDFENIETVSVTRASKELKFDFSGWTVKDLIEDYISLPPRFRKPVVMTSKGDYFAVLENKGQDFSQALSLDELNDKKNLESVWLKPMSDQGTKFSDKAAWKVSLKGQNLLESLSKGGFYPHDLVVKNIIAGSPADKAGLESQDIIYEFNGTPLFLFEGFRQAVQKSEGEVKLTIFRDGKEKTVRLTPNVTEQQGQKIKTVGVYSSIQLIKPKDIQSKPKGFFESIPLAATRTWNSTIATIDGFKKLITSEVSFKSVGGPIAIGKVASDSFNISISYFFNLMALISINLGIINLFPIPVLDGGHILFIGLEILNRKPLSRKKLELAQTLGMSFLLLLIGAALYNDVARFF